ncbi:NAD-dependent epimerase/dehydratase family protein [Oceanidesulfovibrio marinus]|uniref:NAD-dependent epimerase/dehydratase family protein n=1 Tax=Oceanidesulfovibrio marinus TaxID=370038 RepID=A0ABX6NAM5_9BACT|nr:NAD-dependent epimerase/dehydratase family protein [Oceanidesulfovibrio marinus]
MQDTILVLGSNSFSGSHFVATALRKGHRVLGVSRSPEPHPVFLPYRTDPDLDLSRFQFAQYDVNNDLDAIMELVHAEKPAYFVNFASQSMVAESWEHPEHWFRTNTLSQVLLHDKLRRCDFLKKYVHVSTPEVYGSTEGNITEAAPYNPSTPYAVSRAAADMSLMSFYKAYDFPVVFTRAANVFGPGQQLYRIVPRAALLFLTGGVLPLHGGGRSVRSFIYIGDVADATLEIARRGAPGNAYHLSTDRYISIRDLVHLIADMTGVDFDTHVRITGDRLGKDAAYTLDCTKVRQELGWTATTSLEDGIRRTIDWVRGNLDCLQQQPQAYVHKP